MVEEKRTIAGGSVVGELARWISDVKGGLRNIYRSEIGLQSGNLGISFVRYQLFVVKVGQLVSFCFTLGKNSAGC